MAKKTKCKFVTFTPAQRKRERTLKERIMKSGRMLSDVDGKVRLRGHKTISESNKQLKKLYDKIYKRC